MIEGAVPRALGFVANQLGGTFLAPSSTLSVASLAVTLAVATVLLTRGRRASRRLRPRVLARALFPRRLLGTPSGRLDAGFFLLSTFGAGALFAWAIVSAEAVRAAAGALLGRSHPLLAPPAALASAIATAVLFVAYEFAYWLDHWSKHRFAMLWAFHRVHHDAESLSLLTNFRVHPVDTVLFYNLVALVTGAAAAALDAVLGRDAGMVSVGTTNILVMVAAAGLTHLQHSHFWLGAGWRGWLLGPAHHQIHHSADPAHHNRNLGSSLALWDRLFGTFHAPPARRPPLRFGSGVSVAHRLDEALWRPFAELGAGVRPARRPPPATRRTAAAASPPSAAPRRTGVRAGG